MQTKKAVNSAMFANSPIIRTTTRLGQSIQTSIYSAVSDILFILLLILSHGIVNKRSIFISLS